MRYIILTGVASLALATVPALAQDASTDTQPSEQAASQPQSADQANAQAAPAPPTTTVVPSPAASGAGAVVTTYPGNVASPPGSALNKVYPLCSRTIQDSCQNPGEGGAPGHSRALKYWPGKPASEGKQSIPIA